MGDTMFQIGELAERVGLSLRTVRYYEEMGLLSPKKRSEGGFRLYTEDEVDRLALIKQMKPLGFTISEMRELLDARATLRSQRAGAKARGAAAESLSAFADQAAARVSELRSQVERAEGFAAELRRETDAAAATAR